MLRRNNNELEDEEISLFKKIILAKKADSIIPITIFDIIFGLFAFLFFFTFSFFLLYDINNNSIQNIILGFIECGFAFIGIFFLTSNFYRITCNEKSVNFFQKNSVYTLFGLLILFGGNMLITFITGNYEHPSTSSIINLLITFSAISEEIFFRGFLLTYFNRFYLSIKINEKKIWLKYIYIVLIVVFSSYLFTIIHVNRYEDILFLIELFVSGVLFGTYYWITKDLTACIMAHLLRNVMAIKDLILIIPVIIIIALYFIILAKRSRK